MIFALLQAAAEVPALDFAQLGAQLITALVVPLTVVIVWLVRKAIPKIPRALLPFLALGGGPAINALLSAISGVESQSVIVGALLGAAAVWLREAWSTVKEHGLKS
jgi:hypothetical protein